MLSSLRSHTSSHLTAAHFLRGIYRKKWPCCTIPFQRNMLNANNLNTELREVQRKAKKCYMFQKYF